MLTNGDESQLYGPDFDRKYGYQGKLGVMYTPGMTTFKLWAPTAQAVDLVSYGKATDQSAQPVSYEQMERGKTEAPEDHDLNDIGVWFLSLEGEWSGLVYTYRITFPGGGVTETQDPYSTATIINGDRSVVINPKKAAPDNFQIKHGQEAFWRVSHPTEARIYELHVRDFSISETSGISPSNRGKFLGLIETGSKNQEGDPTGIDYLKKLGVNYVQIMPSFDFASVPEEGDPNAKDVSLDQYNWGYDPKNYNVPEGSYATAPQIPLTRLREMKAMIQGLHDAGLGMIMDVVYNHLYTKGDSPFQLTVPDYYFRESNGTGVGNDTASDREMFQKYIIDSVCYWAENYNVDGFRFDLMGILDVSTMNKIRLALDQIDPRIMVYGEGWDLVTDLAWDEKANQNNLDKMPRIGVFNDKIRDAIKGAEVFGHLSAGFVNGVSSDSHEDALAKAILGSKELFPQMLSLDQNINYIEAHDNYNLNDLIWLNNPQDDQESHNKRIELANAINILAQGITFMEIGQEFGRTKLVDINGDGIYGKDEYDLAMNAYNAGDQVNAVNWNLITLNQKMIRFVDQVLKFKADHSAFSNSSFEEVGQHIRIGEAENQTGILTYFVDDEAQYLIVFNASGQAVTIGERGSIHTDLDLKGGIIQISNDPGLDMAQVVDTSNLVVADLSGTIIRLAP